MLTHSFSGIQYEKEYVPLLTQIHSWYTHRLGPGEMGEKRKDTERVYGIIVPHSSFRFGGPAMAWGYKVLSEHYFPETYVLLLPDLLHKEGIFVLNEDFTSPFGICSVDHTFAQKLLDTGLVHLAESTSTLSFELQILFLQQASRDRTKLLKILPLFVSSASFQKVAETLVSLKKDIVVICASDFIGGISEKGEFSLHDKQLIQYLIRLDSDSFARYLEKQSISFLSKDVLVFGIEILKQLGVTQGEIVNYYTAAEISSQGKESFVTLVF